VKDVDFSKNTYQIELDTTAGKITLDLLSDLSPGHSKNMIGLAKIGYYDGVLFHRIIKGFMIQGGCPLGTGTGGPGYTINAEFNTTRTRRAFCRWPAPAIRTRPARNSSFAWAGTPISTGNTRPSARRPTTPAWPSSAKSASQNRQPRPPRQRRDNQIGPRDREGE